MPMRSKRLWLAILAVCLAGMATLVLPSWWISRMAADRCFDDVATVPIRKVGVVLGTSKYVSAGRENHHYRNRMEAAAKLFAARRVEYLLVSGNQSKNYDEPATMRADLVRLGVPADRIYLDPGGMRTLDSVVRAGEIFGQHEFTVVSQRFHNERAIFIGSRRGLDVIGFDAPDVGLVHGMRTAFRERFARLIAVLDVTILDRQPRRMGEPVTIGPTVVSAQRNAGPPPAR
jgi:SanA protein